MQKFLIIQTAFLGDVILATPIISELNRIYPDAKIDVVVRKGNESLLANNPKINHVYIWNKKEGKYKSLLRIIKAIRKQKYDEVITLQRYTNAGLMTKLAKTKSRIGFDKNAFSKMYSKTVPHSLEDGTHEVERNLKTIAHHGAKKLVRPELFPSASDRVAIEDFTKKKYYCLAPASVWETKKLPTSKWTELIEILIQKGEVKLIGGPTDFELCADLQKEFPKGVHNLAGKLTLLQSAALMENAEMNYVNDSGPLHIASAMNAPTRAFFCSTIPQFGFGPLAEDSKIIETQDALDCRPCGFHGHKKCPLGHFDCGHTIEISEESIR
ncbi:glycosyltransferase family 9 protein [Brumimicrobium glaciale]|uniref:Glycosyltransferase family 9 protein n=1 Tax=Brumimicrobium glaciale TaxID=200475 RepID=A0A4Q4KGF3_9FLAO|nr:glycosyltransferase family 9 protein [Brumimicrobium glaciale]RYM31314.1 glycosyltransferase family 9 protein [Brumimicrobium glaciale]